MAKFKCLLFAQRLRRVPRQFRWVDPRRVRDGFIQRCDAPAAALYLFLITVGDAQGLSDYGESVDRLRARLHLRSRIEKFAACHD